jgi:hypothetical protein
MTHDALAFTPQYSVTHICICDICASFKEHIAIAKAIEDNDLYAWKAHNKYEQDLVSLGWIIALTEAQGPESQLHTLHVLNVDLERKNHHLTMEVEALCQVNKYSLIKCRQLKETLELNHLNLELRGREINLWQSQCKQLTWYCTKLEHQMDTSPSMQCNHRINNKRDIQSLIVQLSALPLEDGNTDMHSEIHLEDTITTGIGTTDSIGLMPTSVESDRITPHDRIIDA